MKEKVKGGKDEEVNGQGGRGVPRPHTGRIAAIAAGTHKPFEPQPGHIYSKFCYLMVWSGWITII